MNIFRMQLIMFLRTTKFCVNYPISRMRLKKQIKELQQRGEICKQPCPVCNNDICIKVEFVFENKEIKKYFCLECKHLFSVSLQTDLNIAVNLFDYNMENSFKHE